jgi:two-component system phosphate regulon sensor histidine kinase PhoR
VKGRQLFWQLFGAYSLSGLFVLILLYVVTARAVYTSYHALFRSQIEARALLAREHVRSVPDSLIDRVCKALGQSSGTRITVVDAKGIVRGDSERDPATMPNHADRAEIARALAGETGSSVRASETVHEAMMYVAVPLIEAGQVRTVVRASVPYDAVRNSIRMLNRRVAGVALAMFALLALLSFGVARHIRRPLKSLGESARSFATGDLGSAPPRADIAEIDELGEALAQMASRLSERIATTTRERNEREAMLASMVEGVLAVDSGERVVRMNEACGRILGVSPAHVAGRTIQEAIRNSDLHTFVKRALSSLEPVEAELAMLGDEDRNLQAHGAVLRDSQGQRAGAIVVLNDVTKMKRLERIRRDFVANVSHELKTPIAAIQGAAETLREGALEKKADATRFVEIIERQASRLDAVIRDLLTLSRIEEDEEHVIALHATPLEGIIRGAVQTCSGKAADKGVSVDVLCPATTQARVDAPLLETAIVNLLDNAIKYSEPGDTVSVRVESNQGIVVSVEDQGCGIEPRHLSRLFERFYRVDKARSRTLGGTGLGLAIVKHIVQAHGGHVSVNSTPGVGSSFRIHLPLPTPD